MNDTVKIVSRMNGLCLTVSQGEHKSKAGDIIMDKYYKS